MKKEKIILTDCDGVLVNWNEGFSKYMTYKGHPQLPNTHHEYSISTRHGISSPKAVECIREFNESCYITGLNSFADSVHNVRLLSDLGFRFIVVTSLSDKIEAYARRSLNLTSLFGEVFDEIHCIKQGANKFETLRKWENSNYFWIEDHVNQAEAGHTAGLNPILIDHPYNAHYETDLFPRVSIQTPWAEIVNMVRKEYNV